MLRFNNLCAGWVCCLISFVAYSREFKEYVLIKDIRSELTLPKSTLDEKKIVLDQAKLLFRDLYVHKDLKIQTLGQEANVIPALDAVESRLTTLSDEDFHQEMVKAFRRVRDRHTSYYLPKPFSCYASFLPITFKEALDGKNKKVIAVNKVMDKKEVLALVPDLPVKPGDVLLKYNLRTPDEVIDLISERAPGANAAAVRRLSINYLSFISHATDFLPKMDAVELELADRDGKVYQLVLPWIVQAGGYCLDSMIDDMIFEDEEIFVERPKVNDVSGFFNHENRFNTLFRPTRVRRVKQDEKKPIVKNEMIETAEPILKYKLIENTHGRFGYILLESFYPQRSDIPKVVNEFKEILSGPFADTDGLIIDLRNNAGGLVEIAERIAGLFIPEGVTPLNFRSRAGKVSKFYVDNIKMIGERDVLRLIDEAYKSHKDYTDVFSLYNKDKINDAGQYYFKPVALMTDSACYSACDMFSAQMQDHGAAIIVGEDATTGAGGASVGLINQIYAYLPDTDKGDFKPLPQYQMMSFSELQSFRVGASAGKYIEGVGIESDVILPPNLNDLRNAGETQLDIVTKFLKKLSDSNEYPWVDIDSKPIDVIVGADAVFTAWWEGPSEIEFVTQGKMEKIQVNPDNKSGARIKFPSFVDTKIVSEGDFQVLGKKDGVVVWRKNIHYRINPKPIILDGSEDRKIEWSDFTDYFEFYSADPSSSWIQTQRGLKSITVDGHDTTIKAAVFFKMPLASKLKMKFHSSVESEAFASGLGVFITVNGLRAQEEFYTMTGTREIDLEKYAGKMIKVEFVLQTNFGWASKVSISDLMIVK